MRRSERREASYYYDEQISGRQPDFAAEKRNGTHATWDVISAPGSNVTRSVSLETNELEMSQLLHACNQIDERREGKMGTMGDGKFA